MTKDYTTTSDNIAFLALKILQDSSSSKISKVLASSALSNVSGGKLSRSKIEAKASKLLKNRKCCPMTKSLAESILHHA
jgi:hypothetical protein